MPINYYCDVEVQSNVLTTDTSNSRVGVNIASPATTFHANGVIRAGGSNGQTYTEIGPDSLFIYNSGVFRGNIDLYPNSSSGNLYITGANGTTVYFGAPTRWTTNISVQGQATLSTINAATSDTDKFLVSDGGTIKYRTGAEVRSDIGAGTGTVTGSGTVNQVAIWNGTSDLYGDSGMTWNSTSNVLTVSGKYACSASGSASGPVYYFSGRSHTGMYFNYSPEEIRWSISSTERMNLSASRMKVNGNIECGDGNIFYTDGDVAKLMSGGTNGTNVEVDDANGIITLSTDTTSSAAVTATNFILSSDKRLKENIKDLKPKHLDIKWKSFELKSEPKVYRAGVIAQELEETNPEFVREDKDGLKSVAYIDLLISKIAELEARLEKAGL